MQEALAHDREFLTRGESGASPAEQTGEQGQLQRRCGTCGTCLMDRWLKAGPSPDPRSIGTATRMEGPIGWPW